MPLNIQLSEDELRRLATADLGEYKLTEMPVKNITTDISERVIEQGEEIMYMFFTQKGNVVFKKINNQFQVSSVTGDDQLVLLQTFCQIATQKGISYTTLGFEPLI